MATVSDPVIIASISVVGGIASTYLTVKYKDRVVKRRQRAKPPKDRMDSIFDGYERLILQLTSDMERKEGSIQRMEGIIDQLDEELTKTKILLTETKFELHQSQLQKRELSDQLHSMRKEYRDDKTRAAK